MKCRLYPISIMVITLISVTPSGLAGALDRTGRMWAPYLEWSLKNSSYKGNPYDLIAKVTFKHPSGAEHVTEMFYVGNDTWNFRFTGTKTGVWRLTTSSSDPDLDGHSGSVTISDNSDSKIKGFIRNRGNQFVRQKDENTVEGYVHNVYMNGHQNFTFDKDPSDVGIRDYLIEARNNGCNTIWAGSVASHWFNFGAVDKSKRSPDPKTFEILERMITTAHAQGGATHIWAWLDDSRNGGSAKQFGGINATADRRLQRYIAARLGPLPGWTMGYGFDLHEYVTKPQLQSWADYLDGHSGWRHLLSARGFSLSGSHTIDSYASADRPTEELSTSLAGPLNYNEVTRHFDRNPSKPAFYEERHAYLRWGPKTHPPGTTQLTMDRTRRLLWWQMMAGGVGGFIGFYGPPPKYSAAPPYPNAEQLNTHYQFWLVNNRFIPGMSRANELTDGIGLKARDNKHYVFYRESATSISMDLAGMNGAQPVVAVDLRRSYSEQNLGTFSPGRHKWTAPYNSDWAIAVGKFNTVPK